MRFKLLIALCFASALAGCASVSRYDDRTPVERIGDNVFNHTLYQIEREATRSTRDTIRQQRR